MSGVIFKVLIPDVEAHKTFKVNQGETVWQVKMQLVNKLRVLEHGFNFGFYYNGDAERSAGYLDDPQLMLAYQFQNNTELILKKKQRILHGIPEKQIEKWNNKKQQKSFIELVHKKAYNKIKEILQKAFDPNFIAENGETAMAVAASQDDSQMIAFLVQNGAFLDIRSPDLKTPLHKAAMAGNDRAVQTLLSLGAWVDAKDSAGYSPLFYACINGQGEIAKALLKAGSAFDLVDEKGRTELHHACMKNCPIAVQALVAYGADMHRKNETGNTPLHLAATSNSKECAKALLEGGCDAGIQNHAGDTAFQVGVMGTNWDVADLIGNFNPEHRKPKQIRERKRNDTSLSGLPYVKLPEFIPPPPPPGYKGICPPPPFAPIR